MRLEDEIKQERFASAYHKLVINILFSSNWLREQHTRDLKRYGLTMQQFNILRILRGQAPDPASIGLLQERMLDKQSDVSRLVERLRLKGLVQRKSTEQDRRRCAILITQKGLTLLADIDRNLASWYERLHVLSVREAEQCNRLLDKLRSSSNIKQVNQESY